MAHLPRSFITGVCNSSDWSFDESQYSRLRSYLSPYQLVPGLETAYNRDQYMLSVGEVVSSIAILLWTFSMLREFRSVFQVCAEESLLKMGTIRGAGQLHQRYAV